MLANKPMKRTGFARRLSARRSPGDVVFEGFGTRRRPSAPRRRYGWFAVRSERASRGIHARAQGTSVDDHAWARRRLAIGALANRPLQRAKLRKSTGNLEAHGGPGLRCIIEQRFTASPLNGKTLGGRMGDPSFTRLIILFTAAVVLVGCRRNELSTVLPFDEAKKMMHPCSRPFPAGLDGWWKPTSDDIERADRRLTNAVDAAFQRLEAKRREHRPDRYYRQYAGFLRDGKRVLYMSTLGRYLADDAAWKLESQDWRDRYLNMCDGGTSSFGAVYDLEKDAFDSLMFNGTLGGKFEGAGW